MEFSDEASSGDDHEWWGSDDEWQAPEIVDDDSREVDFAALGTSGSRALVSVPHQAGKPNAEGKPKVTVQLTE